MRNQLHTFTLTVRDSAGLIVKIREVQATSRTEARERNRSIPLRDIEHARNCVACEETSRRLDGREPRRDYRWRAR